MNIYEKPEELLSISLLAETTLLNLTSAYCSFVNGGKLIKPVLIDRIQDSEEVQLIMKIENVLIVIKFLLAKNFQK